MYVYVQLVKSSPEIKRIPKFKHILREMWQEETENTKNGSGILNGTREMFLNPKSFALLHFL